MPACVTIWEWTFSGFELCNQRCPVLCPLLILTACRSQHVRNWSSFSKLANFLVHCMVTWCLRFRKHFCKLLFDVFRVFTSTKKCVFHHQHLGLKWQHRFHSICMCPNRSLSVAHWLMKSSGQDHTVMWDICGCENGTFESPRTSYTCFHRCTMTFESICSYISHKINLIPQM
jgi:hypothetical protein